MCVHLSHCCMILISLMMSWRSESTGTCLMASSCPDSLCTALNTAPYALREGGGVVGEVQMVCTSSSAICTFGESMDTVVQADNMVTVWT